MKSGTDIFGHPEDASTQFFRGIFGNEVDGLKKELHGLAATLTDDTPASVYERISTIAGRLAYLTIPK